MILSEMPNSKPSNKKNRPLASVTSAARVLSYPESISNLKNEGLKTKYCEIDEILFSDNLEGIAYRELIKLTTELFKFDFPTKKLLLNELEIIIDSYIIQKETDNEFDSGRVIDKKKIQKGNHTTQSKWVASEKRSIYLKIKILSKYKDWISEKRQELIKDQQSYFIKDFHEEKTTKIDVQRWLDEFKNLDISKTITTKTYIIDDVHLDKNQKYFKEGSENLTRQLLLNFKKDTCLLDNKRTLEFIDNLKIEKPSNVKSGDKLFDQTSFEAARNYYEFLITYKLELETEKTPNPDSFLTPTPVFSKTHVNEFIDIIKPFFDEGDHKDLEQLLKTGVKPKTKLIFLDNANRLTDSFKQLKEKDLITQVDKKGLRDWLIDNFQALKKKFPSDLIKSTTEKSISGKQYICKNPIFSFLDGKITKC